MKKFEVFERIPDSYKQKFLGEGASGKCYMTSDGEAFKEFYGFFNFEHDLQKLSCIDSPSFIFPKTLVYLGSKNPGTLKGYKMDFVNGVMVDQIDKKTKMETIIKSSSKVEDDIRNLTKNHDLLLFDINDGNVIYDENGEFKLIDTDYFEFSSSCDYIDNLKTNFRLWNEFLLYNFGCLFDIFYKERLNLIFEIAMINGKIPSSHILEEIVEEIRKETKSDVNTIEDYERGIQLIKRRI